MFLSRQLPTATLLQLCHMLRHNLDAGLTLRDVFHQLAARGPAGLRPVAERVRLRLEQGDSLRAALRDERVAFPPLFIAMAGVGEETGHLPEVMAELDKYYQMEQKSWRQLRSRSLLPAMQLVAAVGVVALLIFVLGLIARSNGTEPQAVLGFRGTAGAIQFLLAAVVPFAVLYAGYLLLTRGLGQRAAVDGLMLRLPAIGPCVEALVVGRFALALQLTLDTAMAIGKGLRLSLQATGNAAFAGQADAVVAAVKDGEDLSVALARGGWFPTDFLTMVAVAEEGGRLVDVLRHQAAHYHDEAGRRMKALTRSATLLVWMIYIGFAVAAIFQVSGQYLRPLGG